MTQKRTLCGLVVNVVFLERYGKQQMRSRLNKIKQTVGGTNAFQGCAKCTMVG